MPDGDVQFTPQEFAAKIKAKYPSYASIPDDQLVEKITTKYPQYKSQIKTAPPPATAKPEGFLQKLNRWYTTATKDVAPGNVPGVEQELPTTSSPRDTLRRGSTIAAGMGAPALVGSLAAAPVATGMGLAGGAVGGYAGGKAGGYLGEKVGAPELGEDIGSLVGSTVGAGAGGKGGSKISEMLTKRKVDPTVKINDLLGVTRKEVKVGSTPETLSDFAQNPARGLLKSGLDEKTLAKMNPLERNAAITKARNEVGKQLETVFKNASQMESGGLPAQAGQMPKAAKKVDFQKVMDAVFDDKVIPDEKLAKQTADRLHQILDKAGVKGKLLSELTPEEAWNVRKELDEFADFAPAETARTFRQVATKLRRGLSDSLHKVVPESTPLDQQYGDLVGATKAGRRQAEDFARTTPESKLRKWILKTAIKAGSKALPLP